MCQTNYARHWHATEAAKAPEPLLMQFVSRHSSLLLSALPWLNSTHPNFLYIMQTFPLWNFVPVFSELQVYSNKGGKEGLRWMSPFCSILSHTGPFLFLKTTKLFPTSRPSSPLHSLCLSNSHPWYFGWNITSSGRFSLRSLQLMFSSGLVYFFHQP